MSIFAAPDGSIQPFNTTTVQSFHIPAFGVAFLVGQSNAGWEQAVVVIVNGVRHATQLGTFQRPSSLLLFLSTQPREVLLAGWHKRSEPDGDAPWRASRGKKVGDTASWDDSGGDMDFNDYGVRVVVSAPPPGSVRFRSHAAWTVASLLGLKEAAAHAPDSEARAALERRAAEDLAAFVDLYSRHWAEADALCDPLPAPEAVAAELALAAHTFEDGPMRKQLLQAGGQFAAAGFRRRRASGD